MAEENKKTGPITNQNLGDQSSQKRIVESKELLDLSKQLLKQEGDYINLLKDGNKILSKTISSYESIESQLDNLSKGSINLKEINKELRKVTLDKSILDKKILQFEKEKGKQGSEARKNLDNYIGLQEQIIETEVNSIKEKEIIQKRINDLEKETQIESRKLQILKGKEKENLEDIIKGKLNQLELEYQNLNATDKLIDGQKDLLKSTFERLGNDERAYILNLKSLGLTEEQLKFVLERLKAEDELNDSLGVSGKLMGAAVKSLGLGSEVYQEMVETARKLGKEFGFFSKLSFLAKASFKAISEAAKDPLTYVIGIGKAIKTVWNSAGQAIKSGSDALLGSGGAFSSFVSPISDLISKIPLIGGLLGGIVDIGAKLVDFATGANSETQKFARNLGISYQESKKIENSFDAFSRSAGQAFITVEKLRKSQTELSSALGINNIFSKEILAADSQLAEQLGLELDTRKALAATTAITGQLQTKIFASIAAQTKVLNTNLGINIRVQDTIKKAASFGGVLGLTFAKYPEKLTKSLLITKALGVDLEKINSIADGLLDFESSIANEFEAQLLTGKNINLAKARELALNNDLAGLAVEINNQLGSSEEFLNMNRIQQESISKAVGMSRDELADMLKQQQLFAAAGATSQKQFKDNIKLMQERGTLQDDFLSKLSDEQAQLFLNSTATENIASFMDKIRQGFSNLINNQTFKDFIDRVMNALSDPKFIDNIISKLTNFANLIIKITAALLESVGYIVDVADFLTFGVVIPNEVPETLKKIGSDLGQVSIGKLAADNEVKNAVGIAQPVAATNNSMNPSKQEINIYSTMNVQQEGGTTSVSDDTRLTGPNMLPPKVKTQAKKQ